MIQLQNIQLITGQRSHLSLNSSEEITIPADHLLLLPGLIDPHVHFRTPGLEYKEDWCTAAKASIQGGVTQVFDMPNTIPTTITLEALQSKSAEIDQQLKKCGIPLRYQLFLGADKHHLKECIRIKQAGFKIAGIKIFIGCSTGGMLIEDPKELALLFQIAAEHDILIAVHAESESQIQRNRSQFPLPQSYEVHSKIRDETAAVTAVEQAIDLVRRYGTRLYIVHVSTAAEIQLIAQAKAEGLPVFAEVAPHHLFLTQKDYAQLKGKAIMNPPLRTTEDQAALWKAIQSGIIDTIGSDHAPHTLEEKSKPYGECPAGVPGIETTLALLLNAYHEGLLSLADIVRLTSQRAREIFRLPDYKDYTLVNLNVEKTVSSDQLHTKCQWSPFEGRRLKGWSEHVILNQKIY